MDFILFFFDNKVVSRWKTPHRGNLWDKSYENLGGTVPYKWSMGQNVRESRRNSPIGEVYGTKRERIQKEQSHREGLWDKTQENPEGTFP